MRTFQDTPLAIVGMACRMPGGDNLDRFWQLLVEGRCAIGPAPPERLNRELHFDPEAKVPYKTYIATGGLVQYAPFDASRTPMPAKLLSESEIGHHTICQVAADACRHAGMNPFDLSLRNVGVYIGHNLAGSVMSDLVYGTLVETTAQYLREIDLFHEAVGPRADALIRDVVTQIRDQLPRRGPTGAPEAATRFAASIISESLGLTGPSMILDAACSSGLQGLALATRGLQLGRIDMAIVGGASYYHVDSQIIFSRAQAASPRGVCCPFDADADGFVPAEGYVAVVVKTLERALADGDPIQCVIRGLGVSSDGRGKSLWAPRKEGQLLAIRRAYECGLDIRRVQFIEAHATSTRVGDMTELKALAEALQGQIPLDAKIPLGGVKANIGHTLESAGLAGLVKTVLAIQHKVVPQQIGVRNLNPGIDWSAVPFFVPQENVPWPEFADGHPRRAAVNSFGIGGLNVHVVLDERMERAASKKPARSQPVSAESANSAVAEKDALLTREPIAIIGASCIFPGARTLQAFWELLVSGRDAKCEVPPNRWNAQIAYEPGSRRPFRSPAKRGGFITDFEFDWRRHKIPPNQVGRADPLQLMILDATDAAIADAGYDKTPYDKSRVGVVVGTWFGSDFGEQLEMGFRIADFCDTLGGMLRREGIADEQIAAISKAYAEVLLKHMPALLDETGSFTPSTLASRITKMYDLMGGAVTIDAGYASSVAAIYSAIDNLHDGSCDMMICAAGNRTMGLTNYEGLSMCGALGDDFGPGPFDARAHGHLPGEGVGVVVLKRLSDAQRDGNQIRGIIRGVGASFGINRRNAVAQAIDRAQQAAGEPATDELVLETAGLGLPEYDDPEIAAIKDQLTGEPRQRPLVVSTVVGQIGHTQGASGMASLFAAIQALNQLEVLPRFGLTNPSSTLISAESQLSLANHRARLSPPRDVAEALAGVNSVDSIGSAYHLILQRGVESPKLAAPFESAPAVKPVKAAATREARIVRLGSRSLESLVERVRESISEPVPLFERTQPSRFAQEDVFRLAIVVETAADLADKLKLAVEQIGTSKAALLARKDIFFSQVAEPVGKTAFVFSGQGSQYAGMLKPLVEQFPPAAEAVRRIDATLANLGMPSFAEIAWDRPDDLGTDVWITQLSLLCADTVVAQSLEALGIRPDCVAGHSFGEFPALAAAGAWDFRNAVLGTRARCQAIEACANVRGGMLSVAAGGPVVEGLCRQLSATGSAKALSLGGSLFPANYNAPDQTVVGGSESAIAELEAKLQSIKIACRRLAVPRPFHTPLMRDVQAPLAAGLASVAMRAPQLAVLSTVTNRLVSTAEEMRANLVAQMTTPVQFVGLIGQLADSGVQVIVEVGPHQVLTGLNQKILAGRDIASIACDDKSRGGVSRLLAVRACLECRGLLDRPSASPEIDVFRLTAEAATPKPKASTVDSPAPDARSVAAAPSARATTVSAVDSTKSRSKKNGAHPATVAKSDPVPMFAGTPEEIGRQRGKAYATAIRTVARRYADLAGIEWESADAAALSALESFGLERLADDEQEELRGMAEAAGVSAEMLALFNAWGDAFLTESTTQVAAAAGDSEALHAFHAWKAERGPWADLPLSPALCVLRPASGYAHAVLASPGMLGASAGINETGLAVTCGGLERDPFDEAPGSLRTVLLRRVLASATDIEQATEILCRESNRLQGEFCISHPASGTVRNLRILGGGAIEKRDRRLVVAATRAQSSALVGAASRGQSAAGPVSSQKTRSNGQHSADEFDWLDEFIGHDELEPKQSNRLRQLSELHLGVQMNPSQREIVHRGSGQNGRRAAESYRFEPAAKTSAPSSRPSDDRGAHRAPQSTRSVDDPQDVDLATLSAAEYREAIRSVDGKAPFDTRGRVCQRYVLRVIGTTIPDVEESMRTFSSPALILGSNPVGAALQQQFEALGNPAVVLPVGDDVEKTLAAIDKIWEECAPLHMFVVTPFDADAQTSLDAANWERRRRRGVMIPYFACQRWFAHVSNNKLVEKASIGAVTAMGGNWGLTGDHDNVEGGAITGLIKALCIEFGFTTQWAFRVKLVDASAGEPPEVVAAAILRELRALSPFVEIGYRAGKRYVVGIVHQAAPPTAQSMPTRGRPWLFTGGARGITAAVAHELGRRFGVKLHLVGTSPPPKCDPAWHNLSSEGTKELRAEITRQAIAEKKLPADVWKSVEKAIEIDGTLRNLEAAGIDAVYHACDIGDREAVARLLDEIRRIDGSLEGIVHGAGIELACRFGKKQPQSVSRTIAAKADGAAILMDLTRNEPLRYFFGFGSISGRWGSIGQTDYCLASDMLAKMIAWHRVQRPNCRSICFHWQPWAEIGMAVREEVRGSQLVQQLNFLPAAEGVQHFVDELLTAADEPEVIITDWSYYKRYAPDWSPEDFAAIYGAEPAAPAPKRTTKAPRVATKERPQTASNLPAVRPTPEPVPSLPRVASRQVMRMVDAPADRAARRPLVFAGPALIVGDNRDAQALKQALEARGVPVQHVSVRGANEETLAEIERLLAENPAPHLFLMTGRDPDAAAFQTQDAWRLRRERGVLLPFSICQKWLAKMIEANLLDSASLVAATSLGGDFGFANPVVAPEGGAVTGLLKGVYMEVVQRRSSTMRLKLVDAPADEPAEQLAAALLDELEITGFDVEVARSRGARRAIRLLVEPVEQLPAGDIPHGGCWVFTGGARGITAAAAKELGKRYGLKLHLLGSSPLPQVDESLRGGDETRLAEAKRTLVRKAMAEGKPAGTYWERLRKDLEIDQTLRELKESGVQVTYHQCDVTDWIALATVLDRVRAAHGPIEGIVHGAGLSGAAKSIQVTDFYMADDMVAVKIDAALGLMLLTRQDPVRYFVGFGSISGRFGTADASTYTLANDMLCKLIGWYRGWRPECRAVGYHWHPWGEVGMMMLPVSQHTIKIFKMKMMPPAEGTAHLIDELKAGAPESEVLITDFQFMETFYTKDLLISAPAVAATSNTPHARPATPALITRIVEHEPQNRVVADIALHPVEDPFLREHRFRDNPTLPMVVALEAFAEAASLVNEKPATAVVFREIDAVDALRFYNEEPADVRVHAEADSNGVACRLTRDFRNRRGQMIQKDRVHFTGRVELADAARPLPGALPKFQATKWYDIPYASSETPFYHGPSLQLLKRLTTTEIGAFGEMQIPLTETLIGRRNAAGWLTPSAALDACLLACGAYVWIGGERAATVPQRIHELRVARSPRPGEKAIVHIVAQADEGSVGVFDFTLFGDDGSVIFQAKEYRGLVLRVPNA